MNLYDIAIARKLSGGGGGGSSDFSTAEVTFVLNTQVAAIGSFVFESEEFVGIMPLLDPPVGTFTLALYKGQSIVIDMSVMQGATHTIETTGNATYLANGLILVTGDCTITIS